MNIILNYLGIVGCCAIVVIALAIQIKFDKNKISQFKAEIETLKEQSLEAEMQARVKHNQAVTNLQVKQKSVDALMNENIANDCHAAITWAVSQAEKIS